MNALITSEHELTHFSCMAHNIPSEVDRYIKKGWEVIHMQAKIEHGEITGTDVVLRRLKKIDTSKQVKGRFQQHMEDMMQKAMDNQKKP